MRTIRLLLLTGTVLPTLVLAGSPSAGPVLGSAGTIVVAQADTGERGERRERGGEGQRGGPGAAQRQERVAPERGAEPRPERAPIEKPQPRPERQPAERPEPRGERAPEPRGERAPERARRPEPREERAAPPRQPETPTAPEPARRPQAQEPAPAQRTAPPADERGRQDRPDRVPGESRRPERGQEKGLDTPVPDRVPSEKRQAPSGAEPGRRTPDAVPTLKEMAPAQKQVPRAPVEDSAAPDTNRPAAPNAAPGVPGRPIAPVPDGTTPGGRRQPPRQGDPIRGEVQPGPAPGRDDRHGDDRRDEDRRGGRDRDGLERGGLDRRGSDRRDDVNAPSRPGYVQGGFRDEDSARSYDEVRRDRREFSEGGRTYIREPGRIIVRDRDRTFIRHDENARFREIDRGGFRSERRGQDTVTYLDRPGGEQIVTIVDDDGRLLRRSRRFQDGREVVIIDNRFDGPQRPVYDDVVELPPPDIRIPRNRYVVDYEGADESTVYEALSAPPVSAVERRYTLDQVRYSPQLRARMRSVDIDTITFETGSFTVTPDQAARLSTVAAAVNQAIRANPQEVFLIEGYTDAVGNDVDNLSLSDRRAQSVATVLTRNFQVPPENLTTQGYGEQSPKVSTQGPSRENRRVTVRRITPLIQQQSAGAAPSPR